MKNPEVYFRPIGDSGPLSLYWHAGPYGDAIECKRGKVVAWISAIGDLLGVEFDDVKKSTDHQILFVENGIKIEVWVAVGKVRVKVHVAKLKKKLSISSM